MRIPDLDLIVLQALEGIRKDDASKAEITATIFRKVALLDRIVAGCIAYHDAPSGNDSRELDAYMAAQAALQDYVAEQQRASRVPPAAPATPPSAPSSAPLRGDLGPDAYPPDQWNYRGGNGL